MTAVDTVGILVKDPPSEAMGQSLASCLQSLGHAEGPARKRALFPYRIFAPRSRFTWPVLPALIAQGSTHRNGVMPHAGSLQASIHGKILSQGLGFGFGGFRAVRAGTHTLARFLEHVPHTRGADTDKHLHELRAGGGEEGHAGLPGNGLCQPSLACACAPIQKQE